MHRYRSQARQHATERITSYRSGDSKGGNILPTFDKKTNEAGGLDEKKDRRGSPSGSSAHKPRDGGLAGGQNAGGGARDSDSGLEASTSKDTEDDISKATPPPAPPPDKSEAKSAGNSTVKSVGNRTAKPPITTRMLAGTKRFGVHMKNAILHSWVNVLLVFIPIGIAAEAAGLSAGIVFAMNAVAIIPLAGMLAYATESVARRLGDTLGALLNVSFGNAVELIIFIIALVKNEIQIVQASLLGSILANLLLILGMAFLFGGLRFREQIYNSTVTQMSACLLSLSVMSLLLPTAFYASFSLHSQTLADRQVLKVSRGTSVVLLLVYVLYLLFQLKSHAYMYESTPQEIIDEESHPGVLADIMNNSSSSSDDSSSTDSTDSDTSGSGSIATAGRKIKRVFKSRRRRKSSASTSSTAGSAVHSALSSPSVTERLGNYWESHVGSKEASRRGSTLGAIASGDEADAEHEDLSGNRPRIRDFVTETVPIEDSSKSPERKKHQKKHHKKRHKKRSPKDDEVEPVEDDDINVLGGQQVQSPIEEEPKGVVFADDVEEVEHQHSSMGHTKSSFNMRQLSSRHNIPRPILPKMLSNNVFVTPPPPPVPAPVTGPPVPVRERSSSAGLRRTSSLPDRLNQQISNTPWRHGQGSSRGQLAQVQRSDPLPPFQHQQIRKVQSENAEDSDADEEDKKAEMSRTAAIVLLLISTALVAVCAEFMVNAIPNMTKSSPSVSQAFIGLIILPIVGNAAEHVTAVTVATKNKMDLAIGVAVGSSIQIALFVTPIVVLLGWILDTSMSLYFNLFETISLFVTAFVVNFLVLDGRSNYLEGSLLIAAYVIIALGAFFYPDKGHQSSVGGGAG